MFLLLMPALAADADAKIINGEDATMDDYPATGALLTDVELFGSRAVALSCSSTLIAPDVVLLAAHCVDEMLLTFGVGTVHAFGFSRQADLTEWAQGASNFPEDTVLAYDFVMHPDWDVSSSTGNSGLGVTRFDDIALLFLEEPVDVEFAYLLEDDELDWLQEDVDVEVVGWGMQLHQDSQWEPPPAGSFGIKQMGVSHVNELGDWEFQVGAIESDVRKCKGDSGGPSFLRAQADEHDGQLRLVGVTSHSYDESQCESLGGVDTRVDAYLGWIDTEMRARCEDGGRSWCEEEGIPVPPNVDIETVPETEEKAGLLGCVTAPTVPWALTGLLGLLAIRRR